MEQSTNRRFSSGLITNVLDSTDIVALINGFVPMKKEGKNYSAKCPFHSEKSPSFKVSESKQIYHCFGCGANGDAIGFLMAFSKLSFAESVKDLAQTAGIKIQFDEKEDSIPFNELKELFGNVANEYQSKLTNTELSYLRVTRETAEIFGVGVATNDNSVSGLKENAANKKWLKTLGMTNNGADVFYNRIMFPMVDRRGDVTGFTGYAMDKEQERVMNTSDKLLRVSYQLFGEWQSLDADTDSMLYIVEGHLDVLAMYEAGYKHTMGTVFGVIGDKQLETALRRTPDITFIFPDNDEGHERAAETSRKLLSKATGKHYYRIAFTSSISASLASGELALTSFNFSDYLTSLIAKLEGPKMLGRIRAYLSSMPDDIYRSLFIEKMALEFNVTPDTLYDSFWDEI